MICFVATNYNNSHFSTLYVKSIMELSCSDYHIIIVDNCSNDDERKKLESLNVFPNVTIIYNEVNSGYFPGLNIGIEYARKEIVKIDYYVIGNNDIVIENDFISSLRAKKYIVDSYPVVSPNIVTVDGIYQNPHVIKNISKIREFIYDLYHFNYQLAKLIVWLAKLTKGITDRKDELQHEVAQEIYQGYGACYILTPKFFELFDQLSAPTFLMYEEFFLAKQLESKGFKTYYEPSIKVIHHCHASTGMLPGKFRWQLSKNAHKEYRKHIKIFS